MIHRILPTLALLIAVGACTPSGTYELAPVALSLTATSEQTVAASVVDRRPYVLNGDESGSFLGTERATWGGEKKIKTESGLDLADQLNQSLVEALASRGISASAVPPAKGAVDAQALAALHLQAADRLLVVELLDWRTDVYTRVHLSWRLEATVFDRAGNMLARSSTQGSNPISDTDLKANYAALAIDELSEKLTNLLNERAITDALR